MSLRGTPGPLEFANECSTFPLLFVCRASLMNCVTSAEGCEWSRTQVRGLSKCREAMWSAVKDMGGVKGGGAFYFLVPVPVEEDEAIDVLARKWGVLVTPGRYAAQSGRIIFT